MIAEARSDDAKYIDDLALYTLDLGSAGMLAINRWNNSTSRSWTERSGKKRLRGSA
jgi:hypothetical protein